MQKWYWKKKYIDCVSKNRKPAPLVGASLGDVRCSKNQWGDAIDWWCVRRAAVTASCRTQQYVAESVSWSQRYTHFYLKCMLSRWSDLIVKGLGLHLRHAVRWLGFPPGCPWCSSLRKLLWQSAFGGSQPHVMRAQNCLCLLGEFWTPPLEHSGVAKKVQIWNSGSLWRSLPAYRVVNRQFS